MVRSTSSGYHLEDMLDSKLCRASRLRGSVPSCLLLDPDFAAFSPPALDSIPVSDGPEAEEAAGPTEVVEDDSALDSASANATAASAAAGSANTVGTFTLGTRSVAYRDLPLAARKLDAMLYNIFKLSII